MSCTRRGFLKTIGAAMVGLGLTRMEPLRTFAASTVRGTGEGLPGGPATGPYSVESLRARAVDAARWIGDDALVTELGDVCCWAPAASAIRKRPLDAQLEGGRYFFADFPGGDQLAQILQYTNNTVWRAPRFGLEPDDLVAEHYAQLRRPQNGLRTEVLTPAQLKSRATAGTLDLALDRETGERLSRVADRAEPMWAAFSVFSGMLLDPTDELSQRLRPTLSLDRASHRALARTATVRYNQIVLGATQRAIWSDQLNGENPSLPLLRLSASGYLPLGEDDGRFLLLRVGNGTHLTGYRTGSA